MRGAERSAGKILKALESPFIVEGMQLDIDVSIGIALYPVHGVSAESLFQRADVAMYAAKKKGGASFIVYTPEQDQHSPRHLGLMGELRDAIKDNQLVLYHQPKVDLKTGQIIGMEALVRWQHPELEMLLPREFVLLAERAGLIRPFTGWVLGNALRQCHAWNQAGLNVSIAVNLSRRNLQDPTLPDQVVQSLQTSGVEPTDLILEITESAVMTDLERAIKILTRLGKAGVRFSIDDFGTGYSSLANLQKLPVHEIKIDRTFVRNMLLNHNDEVIVRTIIEMSHALAFKVVAEGVEKKEVLDRLATLGCDVAQGYYISYPLPAAEMTNLLQEKRSKNPRRRTPR